MLKTRKMMHKFLHLIHRSALSLCLLTALVLSACGPGTGGTGVGPPIFTSGFFSNTAAGSVTAAPVCSISCASNLNAQALSLKLLADSITLSSPCASFSYAGPWSSSATGEVTVQGVLESTANVNGQSSRTSQSARLTLQFASSPDTSTAVSVSISDSAGVSILRPVTLSRVSAETPIPTASCS
jgi:hypothetical protein